MDRKSTSSVADRTAPFGSRFLRDSDDVWSHNAWDHVPPPTDQHHTIAHSLTTQKANPVPAHDKQKYNHKPARHWDNFYKMNTNNFFKDRKWLHNEFPELVHATLPHAGPVSIVEAGCGVGNSIFPLLSSNQNPHLQLRAYDYASHAIKIVQNHPLYQDPPLGSIHAAVWDVTSPAGIPDDITPGTIDIVILVFVMSALHPDEWRQAVNNIHKMLKPGGVVLIRDYGRYDLTQLRFKGGRLLDDNFYIRGDKTRVYFFELDELSLLFTGSRVPPESQPTTTTTTQVVEDENGTDVSASTSKPDPSDGELKAESDIADDANAATRVTEKHLSSSSSTEIPNGPGSTNGVTDGIEKGISELRVGKDPGSGPSAPSTSSSSSSPASTPTPSAPSAPPLEPIIHPNLLPSSDPANDPSPPPLFTTIQLGIDRRLIVNRKRQLKMYRVWMQGRFRKI